MKILLVVRWPVGGIRTFIRYVYRNFDPDAYEITIVAPDVPEMEVLASELPQLSVRHVRVSCDPSLPEFAGTIAKLVLGNRYTVVHSHGFTSALCAALPALLKGTTHILTSHDVLNDRQFAGFKGRLKRGWMAAMLASVSVVHSVSSDAQENLCGYFPFLRQNDKCTVISNGIETAGFLDAQPRDIRRELGLGDEVFLIGFFGRFMSQKGFRYLVEAMESLAAGGALPRRPVVIAFGEGGYIREEKADIARRGLKEYFRFLPFTSDVASSMKGVDLVAMPSLWEACPLLAMEALACGTPLIGTSCLGLREVLNDTPAKVVAPRDAAALSRAIEAEVRHSSRSIFEDFQREASARFDVARTSNSIKELYRASSRK